MRHIIGPMFVTCMLPVIALSLACRIVAEAWEIGNECGADAMDWLFNK